jgi:hypothetical protein
MGRDHRQRITANLAEQGQKPSQNAPTSSTSPSIHEVQKSHEAQLKVILATLQRLPYNMAGTSEVTYQAQEQEAGGQSVVQALKDLQAEIRMLRDAVNRSTANAIQGDQADSQSRIPTAASRDVIKGAEERFVCSLSHNDLETDPEC